MVDEVNAAPCPVGSYSSGYARRACTPCSSGFTTPGPGATSKWQCGACPAGAARCGLLARAAALPRALPSCRACCNPPTPSPHAHPPNPAPTLTACPPGFRYADDAAVACGNGFWKAGVDYALACTPCGQGRTTASVTASSAAECALARPGYRLVKSGGAVTGALPCGIGLYSNGGDVEACTPCPTGTTTTSDTSGATVANCLASRGYGARLRAGAAPPLPRPLLRLRA